MIMKQFKNQQLTKNQQRSLKGGVCPSGCFPIFFGDGSGEGGRCAIPGTEGEACFGTIQGGLCCN